MQNSLFDLQNRYARLSEAGDPLERLNAVIDWEIFRPILDRMEPPQRKSAAGRKPTCRLLMFKGTSKNPICTCAVPAHRIFSLTLRVFSKVQSIPVDC